MNQMLPAEFSCDYVADHQMQGKTTNLHQLLVEWSSNLKLPLDNYSFNLYQMEERDLDCGSLPKPVWEWRRYIVHAQIQGKGGLHAKGCGEKALINCPTGKWLHSKEM